MDFLGIGPWEILLILVLALILMGPGRIQEVARTLGKTLRAIKKASADLTTAVTKELEAAKEEPKPSHLKETKTERVPPGASPTAPPSQVDQPTKPGGASPAP